MKEQWQTVISADQKRVAIDLKELWRYKDLIGLYVKRSFKTIYQQTLLGPVWIVLSPLFTTIVFTVIFGNIAKIPTNSIPKFVFYMVGNTTWNLFSNNVSHNNNIFRTYSGLFDKVYFPRIIMPITTMVSSLLSYFIQFGMFLFFWAYFLVAGAYKPTLAMILIPFLWIEISILGTSIGLIVSSFTRRFRDLQIAVGFGLSLMMYVTPVVYPLSEAGGYFRLLLLINPMGPIIEIFRYAFFGSGTFELPFLLLGLVETIIICWLGLNLFSKTERMVMDTI